MYVTGLLEERVVLDCEEEGETVEQTLKSVRVKLDKMYVDKVIPHEGLCAAVHQICKLEPMPILGPNDGRTCYRVSAQILLFRPLPRQILFGAIKSSDALGIRLTTGFFHDIRIPSHTLPASTEFDESVSLWKWMVDSGDRTSDLYYELGASCRFKVVEDLCVKLGLGWRPGGRNPKCDGKVQVMKNSILLCTLIAETSNIFNASDFVSAYVEDTSGFVTPDLQGEALENKIIDQLFDITNKVDPNIAMKFVTSFMESMPSEKLRNRNMRRGDHGDKQSFGNHFQSNGLQSSGFQQERMMGFEEPLLSVRVNAAPGKSYTLTVNRDGSVIHS